MLIILEENCLTERNRHLPASFGEEGVALFLILNTEVILAPGNLNFPFPGAPHMLYLTPIWFTYSKKLLTMATLVCMTGS